MKISSKTVEIPQKLETAPGMSNLQICCHFMAIFDAVFFFATIVISVVLENSISDLRPMRFEIGGNGTITVSYAHKNELAAIWDYLNSQHYSSSTIYNAVYMTLIVFSVSYLIIEVWLSCVLIRGATERSVAHCKKWFYWRICLILATVVVAASDLYQMQYTLTLLIFIPLNIYRMIVIVFVLNLIEEYNGAKVGRKG